MKRYVDNFRAFLVEAVDPSYHQETFYLTILLSMLKDLGGSRDQTKNDIRAIMDVLTVTLVEPEKGGIQRDIGNKYLTSLKIHIRQPKNISKEEMTKVLLTKVNALRGCNVLRFSEWTPKERRKPFKGMGTYKLSEVDYQRQLKKKSSRHTKMKKRLIGKGGQSNVPPYSSKPSYKRAKSAPPGFGAIGEGALDEAMVGPEGLPKDIVVAVDKSKAPKSYRAYYALRDDPSAPLKAGDLDRMEAGIDVYGNIYAALGQDFPYEGHYVVTSVKAANKYGPLLYDVMMELAGNAGLKPDVHGDLFEPGLKNDTESLTDDAAAVWKYYNSFKIGPDGEKHPLRPDVIAQELGPQGEPLPEEFYNLVMPEKQVEDHAEGRAKNDYLAKVYYKRGTPVLDALKEAGKLADASDAPEPSAREELTDLARELDIPIIKKDLSRFDRLREAVRIRVKSDRDELMAFSVQPDLNQEIWEGDKGLHPEVRQALMDVTVDFVDRLDLDVELEDVTFTGSLANYNWSKFSDIDLHIIVDFAEVNDNEELVKKFFDAFRSNWNKKHDIRVKGHEVEIYVQDAHEPHISTGVYSLKEDEWLVRPKKLKPEIDRGTAKKKSLFLKREIDKVEELYGAGRYEEALDASAQLKDKIKRMRRAGLDRSGLYSPENLAFKILRRGGDIEKLFDIYTASSDILLSLDEEKSITHD